MISHQPAFRSSSGPLQNLATSLHSRATYTVYTNCDSRTIMQEAVKPSPRSQDTTADLPYPLSHSHSHSQSQDADGDGDGDGDAPSSIGGPSPARSSKSTGGVAKTGSRESDVTRQVTRKGRACLTCRKLKVKCGGADQGDGVSCQRCRRLGLDCKMSKRLRMSLDDDGYVLKYRA